jgi:hypothetical protein
VNFAKHINYQTAPIKSGLLVGISIGSSIIVMALLLFFLAAALEEITSGRSAAGDVVGIVFLPFTLLIGAPWSLYLFQNAQGIAGTLISMVIGISANSLILGFIIGMIAKFRYSLKKSEDFTFHDEDT